MKGWLVSTFHDFVGIQSEEGRGADDARDAIHNVHEVYNPAILLSRPRRQSHPTPNLSGCSALGIVLHVPCTLKRELTICANTFRERVGRATTTQSMLGMSAPSVRMAIATTVYQYVDEGLDEEDPDRS